MKPIYYPFLLPIFLLLLSCNPKNGASNHKISPQDSLAGIDLPQLVEKKKLTAITLYSSVSYFIYRGEPMGYEYDLCSDFAKSLDMELEIVVANNVTQLVDMLQRGEGDMIAFNLPVTNEMKQEVIYCGKSGQSSQVLVQRTDGKYPLVKDVTELIGKEVYIRKNTKYEQRLINLNNELGGGILIHDIKHDSITVEDMIEMVSGGKIPYTVSEDNIARLNKTYYNNIDVKLEISFPQPSSWAVRKTSPQLAEALDTWFESNQRTPRYQSIIKRYFEIGKNPGISPILSVERGHISIYDRLFKKYSATIDLDWRLMASIAYTESRFDTTATSWAGAKGLMQIMPKTFTGQGENLEDIHNPEASVRAAAKYIKAMTRSFASIEDQNEQIKFVLAAYNSGIGHIYDAQALAKKYGKNPHIWDNSVEEYILLKSNPEFYTDSVCRFGYFRGKETYRYVKEVLSRYEYYRSKVEGTSKN